MAYDDAKDRANRAKHGLSLAFFERFDVSRAVVSPVTTVQGEARFSVIDVIDGIAYTAIVTPRDGALRPISVRRASRQERRTLP